MKRRQLIPYAGIIVVIMVYLACCLTTISRENELFIWGALLLFLLASILYIISNYVMYTDYEMYCWTKQIHTINVLSIILLTVLLLRDMQNIHFGGYRKWVLFLFLFSLIICEYIYFRKKDRENIVSCKFVKLKSNCGVIVILLLFALFSIHTGGNPYNWDSKLYYLSCQHLDAFSVSNLAIYGHIAQTFGLLMKLGTVIFGSVENAAYLVNVLIAVFSIIAFYGIIQYICPDTKKSEIVLTTGIYAFSPYLLGLVNYLTLDYYCACLFPIVVYFAIKEKWVFHIIAAFMFVFTKEPAIVIYAGFCIGYFVYREYKRYEDTKRIDIWGICQTIQYWYMFLIACLWFVTYKLLGPWSAGDGGLQFNIPYIQQKLKVMFVLNFSWIISVLCIAALVIFWRHACKKYGRFLWSMMTSIVFFVGFSCIFKTISHYRYNDILFFSLWVLAAPVCISIKSKWVKNSVLVALMGIMLLASYMTMDPISNLCFDTVSTGNGKMWTINASKHFGDAIIYNKQGLNIEVAVNRTLTDVIEDEDVIILQAKYNNPWMLDGFSDFAILDDSNRKSTFYWDVENKRRELLEREDNISIEMNHVSTLEDIDKLVSEQENGNIYSYIAIYQDEENLAEKIDDTYRVLERDTYQNYNWKLERVRFEK